MNLILATLYTAVGCWLDNVVEGRLKTRALEVSHGRVSSTDAVNLCYTWASAQGYPTFSLQDGNHCFASASSSAYKRLAASTG